MDESTGTGEASLESVEVPALISGRESSSSSERHQKPAIQSGQPLRMRRGQSVDEAGRQAGRQAAGAREWDNPAALGLQAL